MHSKCQGKMHDECKAKSKCEEQMHDKCKAHAKGKCMRNAQQMRRANA